MIGTTSTDLNEQMWRVVICSFTTRWQPVLQTGSLKAFKQQPDMFLTIVQGNLLLEVKQEQIVSLFFK